MEQQNINAKIDNDIKLLAKILLDISDDTIEQNATRVVGGYYFENHDGKKAIISDSCDVLLGDEDIDFKSFISQFVSGKRTNLSSVNNISSSYYGTEDNEKVYTNFIHMNPVEIRELIDTKISLLNQKLDGNITDNEKVNSGYLYWNCKMILRNIKDACVKLTYKYKNDISLKEFNEFNRMLKIISEDEVSWNQLSDLKDTYNRLTKKDDV